MRKLSGLLVAIAMLAVLPAGTISANAADKPLKNICNSP